ncbi:transposase [Actinacidiphila sp. bgisy167]|uniref:transposase n=1 Tax=Actinacidiphila sp. bgisy167 TaxID=3413797 RepID=UPI003D71D13F
MGGVRVHSGLPQRDLPEQYGPWGRVEDLFRRWQRDGTWQRSATAAPSPTTPDTTPEQPPSTSAD